MIKNKTNILHKCNRYREIEDERDSWSQTRHRQFVLHSSSTSFGFIHADGGTFNWDENGQQLLYCLIQGLK